ncbi:ADP,ATP carrier protein 1, chloroplastic [Capsicum chinense]|nr:ADP,ATP carrier protein 1, chloroplastic [Capsicum chinense]
MLLRDLNPSEGLCNGTRLTYCNFTIHVISAKIASGDFQIKHVFIPCIPLSASADENLSRAFTKEVVAPQVCLFYVMAELWGSVVVSVLFWGFSNQITTVDEAKRFYPLFGLAENVVLIFSGQTVKYFASLRSSLAPGVDAWAISLKQMISIIKRDGITKLVVPPLYPQYSISTARSTVRALQNVSNILINASESKLHAQDLEFQQIALGRC